MPTPTLRQVIDNTPFRHLRWGCKPSRHARLDVGLFRAGVNSFSGESDFRVVERYQFVKNAADSQTLGSCTFSGNCSCMEWWIAKTFGTVCQLPFEKLYRDYCDEHNGGKDEGADMCAPFWHLKEVGILPPSATYHRPETVADLMCNLDRGPGAIGMSVHEGFRGNLLHPWSACIAVDFSQGLLPWENPHCMAVFGTNLTDNVRCLVLRQSWGPDYGLRGSGLFLVPFSEYLKWIIDLPVFIDPGPDWPNWRGWERYAK